LPFLMQQCVSPTLKQWQVTWYSPWKHSRPDMVCKKAKTLVWIFFWKSSRTFPKRQETKQKVDFLRNFKCKHTFLLVPSERSHKPFLECFTCRHIFGSSQVIAEKPLSKTINWLLQSLKGLKTYWHWTNVFVFPTLSLFAHEIWQHWSGW